MADPAGVSDPQPPTGGAASRWQAAEGVLRGDDYDAKWRAMAAAGESIHGEADAICGLVAPPNRILDAGCGTGRVAIELAKRGFEVVGLDSDRGMLDQARAKAPDLSWVDGDLAQAGFAASAGAAYDTVVAAGNVMIFLAPGTEDAVVANLASVLAPGGLLVAGFQLSDRRLSLDRYDQLCASAGLVLTERWSTWDGADFDPALRYAVSVHRLG